MSKNKSNKVKNIVNKISLIIYFILCVFSIVFLYNVYKLNVLPFKYLIIVIIVIALYLFLIGLISIKKKIKWKVKIIFSFISILIMILLYLGNTYLGSTIDFLKKITKNNFQTENYYVVVLNDSKYNDINDLKNREIEYVDGIGTIDTAVGKLEEKIKFKHVKIENMSDLVTDLLEEDIDAIFLADYNKNILEENNEEFKNNIRVIHTISLTKETKIESKNVSITEDSFNIYISGIDTYGEISSVARSDVNMIATINPNTKQILLTSIPRDYYVDLAGFNSKDKLTHAGMYGVDTSIKTLEELFGIEINYYARVNFTTLVNLVDILGGITVYSDYAFEAGGGYIFKYGYNNLNGAYALAFARERHVFIDGDRQRGKNQQAVIKGILDKATSPAILSKYTDVLNSLEGTFQTNLSAEDIQKLIKFQLDKMPSWNISSNSVNGKDSSNYTYTFGKEKLYVMEPDYNTVEEAKEKIISVMNAGN